MSTQINVSVALESLRKLSQAQINANRQSHLLQVQRQGQAQKAVDAQQQGQLAQGRDLRGQLLYGIKSDRKRPQPQPFAVYRPDSGFAPGWLLVPSGADFAALVKGIPAFSFEQLPYSLIGPSQRYEEALYLPGSGPGGSNAITTSTVAKDFDPGFQFYGADLFANTTIRAEPTSKACTLEAIIKMPPLTSDVTYAPFSFAYIYAVYNSFIMEFDQSGDSPSYNRAKFSWGTHQWTVDPVASDTWLHVAIVQEPGSTADTRTVSVYLNGTREAYAPDLSAVDVDAPDWDYFAESSPYDVSIDTSYGNANSTPGSIYDIPTLIHGIRFTPRALYTGATYTPPTSITSLA